ncbi:uncharacterized protein BJ212DRAFT_1296885 [Suillus subaureus]|uniref:Uncharacterized protein n=1 Tax=Suillus subaureus TaxID=48587 RepID=A0A9P7EIZ5_9AGAM|nr:uncharacterized protein BJ212DRAFT_1296885 [Suillus subaureus]KAG1822964.1 hypothetical protein BJ212DRAFT_1296885 [Suillus subaureus]
MWVMLVRNSQNIQHSILKFVAQSDLEYTLKLAEYYLWPPNLPKNLSVLGGGVFQLMNDHKYNELYAEEPAKFMQAVSNCLTYLRNKYKKLHSHFLQTGAGVDPSQSNAGNNLLEQVISEFPWYKALDKIWKNNPAYALKMFLSASGADHSGGMITLMSKHKGKEKAPPEPENELMEMYPTSTINPTPTIYPSPAINPSPTIDPFSTVNPSLPLTLPPLFIPPLLFVPPAITCPTIDGDDNNMGDGTPYDFE